MPRTHNEHCLRICIACLKKPKGVRPIVPKSENLSLKSLLIRHLKLEVQDFEFLTKVICPKCRIKIEKHQIDTVYPISVNYTALIENVRTNLSQTPDSTESTNCECEICSIGSTSLHADKSAFLIETEIQSTAKIPLPRIADFFAQSKDLTKQEKIKKIREETSPGSLDQLVSDVLSNKEKDSDNNVHIKRVHGPPMKLNLGTDKKSKTVLDHKTLFRIKNETNASGNKILKIAKLIKNNSKDVKIEPNFKEALVQEGRILEEFFESKVVDTLRDIEIHPFL